MSYPDNMQYHEDFSAWSKTDAEHGLMKKRIVYEQPLNERVRSWLRLEHLFSHIDYRLKSVSSWDSRAAVAGLLEILDFLVRNDLKPDLNKELERQIRELERLQGSEGVDQARLGALLGKLSDVSHALLQQEGIPGKALNDHPLLSSIRQRSNIPGGTCRFDLPAYHFWLQRSPKDRQNELYEWLRTFEPLRNAIELCLYLARNNAQASQEVAVSGFFQAKLENDMNYQLLRVSVPSNCLFYPEISGGKHRFSIRFLEYNTQQRAEQTEQDVPFELCCCVV